MADDPPRRDRRAVWLDLHHVHQADELIGIQCSEVNETLVKLRDAFGYAVEVPMAQLDAFNRTMDTHYSGAPITDPQQGIYGDCTDRSWSHLPLPLPPHATTAGCPFQFEHVDFWKRKTSSPSPDDPTIETGDKYAVDPSQWYAWWGGTTSGGNGGSRLDTIILVGRGWAYDDPSCVTARCRTSTS